MGFRAIPHILIVDDEAGPRQALERNLQQKNPHWHISTADSVEAAISLFRARDSAFGAVDVVLTDLVMYGDPQAGMKVVEAAKLYDPLLMVILFTAKEKEVSRFFAFELGAFDCIEKNVVGREADDEISLKANVALKFRELTLEEVENRRHLAVLARYFDPHILEAVRSDPTLLEVHPRIITTVFWDIRGFSQLCEDLKASPDVIHGFLVDYYTAASEAVFKNGGILDKFIGDGVMALFGALADRKNDRTGVKRDAINAVEAALQLREVFRVIVEKWSAEWSLATPKSIEVALGSGIHTGQTLVGNFGIGSRDQFTAVGAHVNFAARIQHRARQNQILVSASTHAMLSHDYELREVETVDSIKGIPGHYTLYALIRRVFSSGDTGAIQISRLGLPLPNVLAPQ